jgi:disulfide bond formation protein DsbB
MFRFTKGIAGLLVLGALLLAACGGNGSAPGGDGGGTSLPAGDATAGSQVFAGTCSACHGPDAKGVPGLGKDLTTSTFVAENSDAELLAFVKTGRPASDPLNTTGVDMPPKGGNPALTDQDLINVIAYLRSIHE